mgnify:CR=1 FL=1|jgi:uncharacterized protein YndB with AHSA1/START domain
MTELTELHKTLVTLPSDTEIRTERIFDAPPEIVYECWTDPEVLAEWMGPDRLAMTVEEFDVRPGGKYRYVHRDPDGGEFIFFGEFLEIEPPTRLVQTFNFIMEPQPPPSIDRLELIPIEDGRTRMVTLTTFEAKEYRDGMIQSGMEKGMNEGFARLDKILENRK